MNHGGNSKLYHIRHYLEINGRGTAADIAKANQRLLTANEVNFICKKSYPEQFIIEGEYIVLADDKSKAQRELLDNYKEYLQGEGYAPATIKQATTVARCAIMPKINLDEPEKFDFEELLEHYTEKHYRYHIKMFAGFLDVWLP